VDLALFFVASGATLTSPVDMLLTHPAYERVKKGDGLFYDPISKGPSKQNLWSVGEGESGDGSWVDLSAPEARKWWSHGVQGLIDLGVDGMWE
jgi:alpha-glucosidase (family GH31 glycosyl hydrolase)